MLTNIYYKKYVVVTELLNLEYILMEKIKRILKNYIILIYNRYAVEFKLIFY